MRAHVCGILDVRACVRACVHMCGILDVRACTCVGFWLLVRACVFIRVNECVHVCVCVCVCACV